MNHKNQLRERTGVVSQLSDTELINLARVGDASAFGELWSRHKVAGEIASRGFTGFDPEEIVQEAFTKIFEQVRCGKGPDVAFRAYLIRTARNIAVDKSRSAEYTRTRTLDDGEIDQLHHDDGVNSEALYDKTVTGKAFKSLPSRWQEILWYREVEDLPVKDCARFVGLSEGAATALLRRAREGFKLAWIRANLRPSENLTPECEWTISQLARYSREQLDETDQTRVTLHLSTCVECEILNESAQEANNRLASVLLPIMIGAGAPGYMAWTQLSPVERASSVSSGSLPPTALGLVNVSPLVAKVAAGIGAATVAAGLFLVPLFSSKFETPEVKQSGVDRELSHEESSKPTQKIEQPESSTEQSATISESPQLPENSTTIDPELTPIIAGPAPVEDGDPSLSAGEVCFSEQGVPGDIRLSGTANDYGAILARVTQGIGAVPVPIVFYDSVVDQHGNTFENIYSGTDSDNWWLGESLTPLSRWGGGMQDSDISNVVVEVQLLRPDGTHSPWRVVSSPEQPVPSCF